jgi:hypothetical protein
LAAAPVPLYRLLEYRPCPSTASRSATAGGSYVVDAATATLDASGATSAISYCATISPCESVTGKTITLAPNPNGGFDRTSSDGWTDRVFAFQAGSGDLMRVNVGSDGSVGFWTQQRSNALPTVGTRNRNWDLRIDASLAAVLSDSSNSIASVDSRTGSAVRTPKTASGATYSETLQLDTPRDGYNVRPAATVAASDGSSVSVREFTSLAMRGMGFSPLKLAGSSEQFLISVARP